MTARYGLLPFIGAALLAAAMVAPTVAPAEDSVLVAARSIRAGDVIAPGDVLSEPGARTGALSSPGEAVGLEARISIFRGRPVMARDLQAPALVDRNQIVTMRFRLGALEILTEGRALGRAGHGERVRVMNVDSRVTVTATVVGPGLVETN